MLTCVNVFNSLSLYIITTNYTYISCFVSSVLYLYLMFLVFPFEGSLLFQYSVKLGNNNDNKKLITNMVLDWYCLDDLYIS